MRAILGIALVLMSSAALSAQAARSGVIRGVVVDANDRPMAAARAWAYSTGAIVGMIPNALTDDSGQFVITHLAFGRYQTVASKEQDLYPDQTNLFYLTKPHYIPGVTITLDRGHPEQQVTVRIGDRAAAIAGTVTDATTGEGLRVCAELRRKDRPSIAWSGDGLLTPKFRVLVPADVPFSIVVWQQGYDPWFYQDESGGDSLRIRAGEEVGLQIRLHPKTDKHGPISDREAKRLIARQSRVGCTTGVPQR